MEATKENINAAIKRKIETVDGPSIKKRKDEPYDLLLKDYTNQWKIETTSAEERSQKNLVDPKNYNFQLIDRQVQCLIDRPSVARAVLHTALSLLHRFSNSVILS